MGKVHSQGSRDSGKGGLGGILQWAAAPTTEEVQMVQVKLPHLTTGKAEHEREELQGNTMCSQQLLLTIRSD